MWETEDYLPKEESFRKQSGIMNFIFSKIDFNPFDGNIIELSHIQFVFFESIE